MTDENNEGLGVVAWQLGCQTMTGEIGWKLSWHQSGAGVCARLKGDEYEQSLCRHSEALAGYAVRDAEIETWKARAHNEAMLVVDRDARIAELDQALDDSAEWDQKQLTVIHSLNERNDQLRAELAAIKAQEPVAWMLKNEKGRIEEILPYMPCASDMQPYWPEPFQLYAAPVAKQVVMPERKQVPSPLTGFMRKWVEGWNECIGEFARLNAADQGGGV